MSDLNKLIYNINMFQENPFIHHLTCGNDSSHNDLKPFEEDGKVVLKCPDCDYTQVVSDNLKRIINTMAIYNPDF